MAAQINASFQLTLSDDPAEMAKELQAVAAAWGTFATAVSDYHADVKFGVDAVRTSRPGYKRGRRRKLAPVEAA